MELEGVGDCQPLQALEDIIIMIVYYVQISNGMCTSNKNGVDNNHCDKNVILCCIVITSTIQLPNSHSRYLFLLYNYKIILLHSTQIIFYYKNETVILNNYSN